MLIYIYQNATKTIFTYLLMVKNLRIQLYALSCSFYRFISMDLICFAPHINLKIIVIDTSDSMIKFLRFILRVVYVTIRLKTCF